MNKDLDYRHIDLSQYREIEDNEYCEYYGEDTAFIIIGEYSPRYFVKVGTITKKAKQIQLCITAFDNIISVIKKNLVLGNKEIVWEAMLKMMQLQEQYPKIALPELPFSEEEKVCLKTLISPT